MTAEALRFDFNSLLMFGWIADGDGNLVGVNRSLRHRIERYARGTLADAASALARLDAQKRVTASELLCHLVDADQEPQTPAVVARVFERLRLIVEDINHQRLVPFHDTDEENEYEVRYSFRPSALDLPLVGARLMRTSGTLLRPSRNEDRVDISIAAVVELNGNGLVVRGFEGAMNEAWSRIESALARGTQAGAIALMSRNLAHNIGSHALYWLSRDFQRDEELEEELVFETRITEERRLAQVERIAVRRFYQYLQIRMELLAGFATRMPLSTSNYELGDLVKSFSSNSMLLERLCKSEGVSSVWVQYHGPERKIVGVSVPGGQLGVHAFYALLENCIRDSAKYAPRQGAELVMHVHADVEEGVVRVTVHDEAGNFDAHSETLVKELAQLRIADDAGMLVPGGWGLKERFISAALLRGVRLENIPLRVGDDPRESPMADYQPDGRHSILEIANHDGNLAWQFYFLRPAKRILLVHGRDAVYEPEADVEVISLRHLQVSIDRPTAARARYVVGFGLDEEETNALRELRPHLPDRLFLDVPPDSEVDPLHLQREWVRQLLRRHTRVRTTAEAEAVETAPPIVIADTRVSVEDVAHAELLTRKDDKAWIWMSDPEVLLVDETFLTDWLEDRAAEDAEPAIVFKRHRYDPAWDRRLKAQVEAARSPVRYMEIFSEGARAGSMVGIDPLRPRPEPDRAFTAWRLLEAALTRVLIIDERIDMTIDESERRRLGLGGIDIAGHEYASRDAAVTEDLMYEWINDRSYEIVVVHRGILDKLKAHMDLVPETVISRLEKQVPRVIVHSGRVDMGGLPPRTKFLSLSNLSAWIDRGYSKLEIVDELGALRRV